MVLINEWGFKFCGLTVGNSGDIMVDLAESVDCGTRKRVECGGEWHWHFLSRA